MNLSLKVALNKLYSNVVIVAIPLPVWKSSDFAVFLSRASVFNKGEQKCYSFKDFQWKSSSFFKMCLYAQDLFHGQF